VDRLLSLDGRWIVGGALVVYFATIGLGALRGDYAASWVRLGVAPMYVVAGRAHSGTVPFGDTHNLLAAVDCARAGFDVKRENPCDIHGRPLVYSRAWLLLQSSPITREDTIAIGVLIALSFFCTFFVFLGRIDLVAGALYSALLCSPSIMLGVERGNTDLIVFQLVAWAVLMLSRGWGGYSAYGLILIGGILKFFPIAGLATLLRETRSRSLALIAALSAVWLLLVLSPWEEVFAARGAHVSKIPRSYGALVLRGAVLEHLRGVGGEIPALVPGALLCAIAAVAVAAAAWGFARARNEGAAAHLDAFRAGAAIYATTYFLPVTSWDYKLVFALLMIPQILEWASVRPHGGLAPRGALAAFLATLWLSREHHAYLGGEVLNLGLLAYSLHMLLRTRPAWLGWTSARERAGIARS
jgi:hypothetical protein